MFSIKYAFSENLSRVIPEPAASLAGGELLGEKRLLDKKLNDALKISGVSHIVVLSGYNVTIVSETIMRALSFLPKNISLYGALSVYFYLQERRDFLRLLCAQRLWQHSYYLRAAPARTTKQGARFLLRQFY